MNNMTSILDSFICFSLFVVIQSLFINGVHYCFGGSCTNDISKGRVCVGNVFFLFAPEFFQANKEEVWARPIYSCPRCMSSFWSIVTFLPLVVYLFGFHWVELFAWVIDAVSLVSLNWIIYKKL